MIERTYLPEGQLLTTPQNRECCASLPALERALAAGTILEGIALMCDSHMDLLVDLPALPGVRGVIPHEEAVWTRPGEIVKDIAILTRVGRPVCFKVQSIGQPDPDGRVTLSLSRRAAQAECAQVYIADLCPGDIIRGRVTHLEPFGAFVDIGCGVSALLPVDALSVSRIRHPGDRLWCGELIWTVVRSIDPTNGRVFLSTRELLGTWSENASRFEPGQTVTGILRSVESYGAFVELAPNLAGLAELREGDREALTSQIGRTVAVFIKSIQPERMKIKLVLIDISLHDPIPTPHLSYFIRGDKTDHMDHWEYSPPGARRFIGTTFE